jgi:hypothetical protein
MMTIDRVVDSMTSVPVADSKTKIDRAVVLMTTDRVVATAVSMTVPAVVSKTKKSRVVAVRAMSARKTRCTTARRPLVKSA